ncbi:universal stress protein [Streptomyces sp. TRM66268-LWL]|uniref:Universal stress protein n=1 Tax=Streptomyces polyasparticus TaxID=2767826 RepID=A0ABR7SPI4_9ACTN|nr:universal stress protein [Streptomyces polyasparticus]MBC9717391.1 universal stress protein [Streptomyces polyasparticus]
MDELSYGSIVVGVDGSAASLAALRWAADQAAALRSPLVAVHAWLPTARLRAPYAPAAGLRTAEQDLSRAAETLEETVARLLRTDRDARVHALVDQGPPVAVLLRHARHALLLALGRSPREEAAQPALGAVAREVARRAPCPVVTVPEPPREARPGELPWLLPQMTA